MLLLAVSLLASEAVTKKNWEHHPAIEAVRAIVSGVDAAKPRLTRREVDCEFESRVMLLDSNGTARFYEWSVGSDDSSHTEDYYYDAAGGLRFLHGEDGAVPSAHSETRAWFDESGAQLWTIHSAKGEGMHFNPLSYPQFVVRDPKKHFAGPQSRGSEPCTAPKP